MKKVIIVLIGSGWLLCSVAMGQGALIKTLDSLDTLAPPQRLVPLSRLYTHWPRSMRKDTSYIRLVVDLARAYVQTNNAPTSMKLLKQVIAQVHRQQVINSPSSDQLLKAYYRLMFCQQRNGLMADALQTGQQGIALAQAYPRSQWTSNLYTTMAYVSSTEGDYEQANSLAERGTALALAIQQPYCIANGFFEQAKAMRSLMLSEEAKSIRSQAWLNRAHRAIDQAIAVGRKPPGIADLSLYYTVKASLYQHEKRFADAEFWFQQAIALNRPLNDTVALASNYTDLGYFYSETRNYALAIKLLTDAVRLQRVSSGRAVALDNLGVAYQRMGQRTKAMETLQRAIHELIPAYKPRQLTDLPDSLLTRSAPNKEFLLPILENLAETWLQQDKTGQSPQSLANALRTYTLADQLVDYMRWEQSGQQSKIYWRKKTHTLYERAVETCFRLNDPVMAYRFMEKSRAVLLTDKLNELGARRQLLPQLAEEEQLLSRTVSVLRSQLDTTKPGTRGYGQVQSKLLIEQEKSDVFVRQMAKTNPLYYRYRYDNAIRPLAEVKDWLKTRNQSLISYFVGDSALYVLGVTGSRNRLIRQPIKAYKKGVQNWQTLLNDPSALNSQFSRFVQTGAELYHLLLAPLQFPNGRVIVSPDGFFMPFEALSRSGLASRPDYLVNTYAFSYVYSVNRMVHELPVATDGRFLGMAPVQFDRTNTPTNQARLPDLPGSAESLERVSDQFVRPTVLTGPEATRAQFRALAPTASVVQLFTHADADTLHREPVLYFADSSLHLSDLQTGPAFQTQLLVLSACRTGVGSHQKGEGVFSLARGFAALGVPSMLTTLWSVESGPTYTITELFYERLAADLPKDMALQQAKQHWLHAASRSEQLPHIWASLILIGDSQPLPKSGMTMKTGWLWMGGGLAVLLGGWLFIRRRRVQRLTPQSGNWKPSLN